MTAYMGEIAALFAAVCFSIGPTFNTLAGKHVNPITVNRGRLIITTILLILPHWFLAGSPFPFNAPAERWFWFGVSGLVSLVLGDSLLFAAFGYIGTRLTMLLATLTPVVSALLAWLFLGEVLSLFQIGGVLITLLGVVWVLIETNNHRNPEQVDRENYRKGLLLALMAAIAHAVAAIAAKNGLSDGFPAISGHLLRTSLSLAAILIWTGMQKNGFSTLFQLKHNPLAVKYIVWGAIFGPLIGMWLSLYAIQNTKVGIATALTSLPPIFLIPIGYFLFKERITIHAILGSVIAVAGVALIFLF